MHLVRVRSSESAAWPDRLKANRLCVLGPVMLRVGNDERPLAGLPARLVVALAVAGDHDTSPDELIDLLWGREAQPSVRASLHVHLSTARRWLSSGSEAAAICRSSAGYRLVLGDLELDSSLMTDLLAGAHPTLRIAPQVSLEMLTAALELWRGPLTVHPWACVPLGVLRLEASRLVAEELLVEALLSARQWAAAEQHAQRFVVEEPFRELRWAQLARARYLDSRPRDALRTYQDARRLLLEDLGCEPGPMLRELERAILVHDLVAIQAGPDRRPAPRSVPPSGPPILGREAELRRCLDALGAGRVVVLHGAPGVGKTRLAEEVARSIEIRDVTVWADAHGHDHPIQAIAAALAMPRESTLEAVVDQLSGPRILVVLDNAERMAHLVEEVLPRLAQALPDLGLLIVSRSRVSYPGVYIELRTLPVPLADDRDADLEALASVRVFRAALADLAPMAQLRPDEIVAICRQTGGLPLAIRLAAGAMHSLDASLRERFYTREVSSQLAGIVASTMTLLSTADETTYASLAVIIGDFDAELGAAVAGVDLGVFVPTIVELVNHGLVEVVAGPPARYRILPPLRDAAELLVDDPDVGCAALDRLTEHCLVAAKHLRSRMRAGETIDDVEGVVRALEPRARQAMTHLAETLQAERALELVGHLESALYTTGWWTERSELLSRALAVEGPPSVQRARAMAMLGRPGSLSQIDVDLLGAAVEMARAMGEVNLAVFADHLRGIGLWWRGEVDESLAVHQRAAEHFHAVGRQLERLEALKFFGVAQIGVGRLDEGFELLHYALAEFSRLGIEFNVAHCLAYLGHCHRSVGDDDSALADLQRALAICQRLGNRGSAIHVHIALGEIAADRGVWDEALGHGSRALQLIGLSRLAVYEPWAWTLATRIACATGDIGQGRACAERAVSSLVHAPGGDTARLAFELADIAWNQGDPRRAALLLSIGTYETRPREIPIVPASEVHRWRTLERELREVLGADFDECAHKARRLTVGEVAFGVFESSILPKMRRAQAG